MSMTALDTLKTELAIDGWNFQRMIVGETGVDWAAYKRLDGTVDCHCNEKPAQLWLEPWSVHIEGHTMESVTIAVRGALDEEQWIDLKAYNVPVSEVMNRLPRISNMLRATWNAAHDGWKEELS